MNLSLATEISKRNVQTQRLLTNPQRNFSEIMFFERRLCLSRRLKWKNAVDVYFEWASLDQLIPWTMYF